LLPRGDSGDHNSPYSLARSTAVKTLVGFNLTVALADGADWTLAEPVELSGRVEHGQQNILEVLEAPSSALGLGGQTPVLADLIQICSDQSGMEPITKRSIQRKGHKITLHPPSLSGKGSIIGFPLSLGRDINGAVRPPPCLEIGHAILQRGVASRNSPLSNTSIKRDLQLPEPSHTDLNPNRRLMSSHHKAGQLAEVEG